MKEWIVRVKLEKEESMFEVFFEKRNEEISLGKL